MTSVAKDNGVLSDNEGVVRKTSTQDHAPRSSVGSDSSVASLAGSESLTSPVEQACSPQGDSSELSLVINHIKALTDGSRSCTPYWSEFRLSPQDFEELKARDKRKEFDVKRLRYDYSAADGIFALRMPNYARHEFFLAEFEREFWRQLDQIPSREGLASTTVKFVNGILCGSRSIYYPPPFSTVEKDTQRSPDASWQYCKLRFPSCIVEVADSQTTKKLAKLAREYIFGTRARVRTVVGFDFHHRTGKGAKLWIWRPMLDDEGTLIGTTCELVEIRTKDGLRNQDTEAGLRLTLEDFAWFRPIGRFDLDQISIFMPVSHLCDMLERAEEEDQKGNSGECLLRP